MGALLATLGFYTESRGSAGVIHMREEMSDEQLVANIMAHATKNLYREQLYVCDLYNGLDERIPAREEEEDEDAPQEGDESLWRMNVDHPIVYVLIAQKGQQPIHIVEDVYGTLVVYKDAQVKDGVAHLRSLCSKAGYEFLNVPEAE